MKRVSIAYDEDDYVEWTAWAKAKGFRGKEPIAVAHAFCMNKYRNVAPLTKDEAVAYSRYLEEEKTKMKVSQGGTIQTSTNTTV